MTVDAESLLLATGLVAVPDRTALSGSADMLPGLKREMTAALTREEPDRLYVVKLPGNYFKELDKEPDYEGFMEYLGPRIGQDRALAYQLVHENARQILLSRRTTVVVTGIMGEQVVANDPEADEQWELECAQVEQIRFVKDFAAGALLTECVDVFRACCPLTYRLLVEHLDDELNRLGAKSKTWAPDPYLEDGIRMLLGLPWDAPVQVTAPAEVPPPKTGKTGGGGGGAGKGFDTEQLLTTAQKASQ